MRAVLEAVAFMLRRNLELLAGAGASATEIHSHGGGARSPLWNQIKADVCGRPVVTLDGDDAAIRGDAMLAGVAAGIFADLDEAGRAMVRTRHRFTPEPAAVGVYEGAYAPIRRAVRRAPAPVPAIPPAGKRSNDDHAALASW